MTPDEHATRIRELGLPEVVVTIALFGGQAVHPALADHAESVWDPAWTVVDEHPSLVPLWSYGVVATLAAPDGMVFQWSAEDPDEPLETYPDFATAVRALLTDMWEADDDESDRRAVAELLLPASQIDGALVPIER